MKKEIIDVNELREPIILKYGLQNIDNIYTFYYDETNNMRALKVTENGLNIGEQPICFALGGVVHKGGTDYDIEFNKLHSVLQLQKSTKEIKLSHLAKGDFFQILESKKIEIFFEWLLENNLMIHFYVMDVIYWSVVDIVDTIIYQSFQEKLAGYHVLLKNDLYKILRKNLTQTLIIFKRYSYPKLCKEDFFNFASELKVLLEYNRNLLEDFSFYILKGLLEGAMKVKSTLLFKNEEPNILIKDFISFYITKIYLFKNSLHVLDKENIIEDGFDKIAFYDKDKIIRNYQFVDSKNEICIQISDIIIGILGKCFTFLNAKKIEDIIIFLTKLSLVQRKNLSNLKRLIDRSITQNAAFAHYVISAEDEKKASLLLEDEYKS